MWCTILWSCGWSLVWGARAYGKIYRTNESFTSDEKRHQLHPVRSVVATKKEKNTWMNVVYGREMLWTDAVWCDLWRRREDGPMRCGASQLASGRFQYDWDDDDNRKMWRWWHEDDVCMCEPYQVNQAKKKKKRAKLEQTSGEVMYGEVSTVAPMQENRYNSTPNLA